MNKKRLFLTIMLSLFSAVLITGCTRKTADTDTSANAEPTIKTEAVQETAAVTLSMIYEARTPYIGEAPAVGTLTGLLKSYYGIMENHTTELQTNYSPYGLTLHFDSAPDNIAMQKTASVLISLIANCSSVSWDYPVDTEGNRERFYFRYHDIPLAAKEVTGSVRDSANSEDTLKTLMNQLESVKENLSASKREETVECAVSAAILGYHAGSFSYSELSGEGHIILDTETSKDGAEVTVYALTSYGGYQFQNDNFVKNGGTGAIPAVISLTKEPDGLYQIKHFQTPLDGGEHLPSIHELFPKALWEQCVAPSNETYETLKKQEQVYAAAYLKSIGRADTAIGDYGDFPHTLLTDAGISVDVSNKLSERTRRPGTPAAYAPPDLGTIERLEGGVRYIYQTSCDPESKEIIYSKFKYDTKELIEKAVYDSDTGEIK